MNDYDMVRMVGTKSARKLEKMHDGLVHAREQAMLDIQTVGVEHVQMIQEAILSCRAQMSGVTLEWYKQIYCF